VISCYPVSVLHLDGCAIGDKETEYLVKYYPSNNSTGQLLKVLDLSVNDLTTDGLVYTHNEDCEDK